MQADYALYIRREVYAVVGASSRAARDKIIAFIESLPVNPFQSGDYSETDSTGRDCQVKIIGKTGWLTYSSSPHRLWFRHVQGFDSKRTRDYGLLHETVEQFASML